jgi:hypothetical protein
MFENSTVNLSALRKSYAKIACCSSDLIFTYLYAGSSIQNASQQFVWYIHLSFVNFALHQPIIKHLTQFNLQIQTPLSR